MTMNRNHLDETLSIIRDFYDNCKVGYEGCEGYRKSTDLSKFIECARELEKLGHIDGERTVFADLGCADGRVNVLMSYFVKRSLGIEIDLDILSEFGPQKEELTSRLKHANLLLPFEKIHLFHGSSLEAETFGRIYAATGVRFADVDLFYTYITLHDVFAEKIAAEAKNGALYLVYGFHKILPHYGGLDVVLPDVASQGIAALYRKRE